MTVSETFLIKEPELQYRLTPIDPNRSYLLCPKCRFDSKVEPFKVGDGSMGIFYKCVTCNGVVSESQVKHASEIKPLGHDRQSYDRKGTYMAVRTNRRTKTNTSAFIPTEDNIPLLAGKPDSELIGMLTGRPAIIASITDQVGEEDDAY